MNPRDVYSNMKSPFNDDANPGTVLGCSYTAVRLKSGNCKRMEWIERKKSSWLHFNWIECDAGSFNKDSLIIVSVIICIYDATFNSSYEW